jgi:hypothetical protein
MAFVKKRVKESNWAINLMSSTEPVRERYLRAKREKSCPLPVSKAIGKILFNIRPGWKSFKDNRREVHKTIKYSPLALFFAPGSSLEAAAKSAFFIAR